MSKWLLRGLLAGLVLLLAFCGAWFALVRQANADMAPIPRADTRASFERSVAWMKAHESTVLGDGNSALWWMVKAAADRTQDPYLTDLVSRSINLIYAGNKASSPWRKLVDPQAVIVPNDLMVDELVSYQRFYYYAATCRVVEADQGGPGSQQFLERNQCRPLWRKVFLADTVCSTHQLYGIRMARQSGCQLEAGVSRLEEELLGDIEWQLRIDPVFQDGYVQRVLAMQWVGGASRVKPAWIRQVLAAQRADGGWSGDRLLIGVPDWLQPSLFRRLMSALMPGRFAQGTQESAFHATAQGLLLMALASTAPDAVVSSVSDR